MGLFGSKNKTRDRDYINLAELLGLRIEVMTREEKLIFAATLGITPDGNMELRPLATPRLDPSIPRYPVMLRGYQSEKKEAIHINCFISAGKDGNWNIEETEVVGRDNDREFFRLETSIPGEFTAASRRNQAVMMCQIINVSAGGLALITAHPLEIGEKLTIRSVMLESKGIPPMICTVCRCARRKAGIEYGCEFDNLSPQMEEKLVRTVMDMEQFHSRM